MTADREVAEVLHERLESWFGDERQAFLTRYLMAVLAPLIAARERAAAEQALREAADVLAGLGPHRLETTLWLYFHADAIQDTP